MQQGHAQPMSRHHVRTGGVVFAPEGKLAVDVLSVGSDIHILAPMAGVDPQTIDIHIHNDVLTIRGARPIPESIERATEQYHAECYWGPFSRTVVLPVPVLSGGAIATYASGILTVTIPKQAQDKKIPITIVEE